jgi:hypothetical protein
VTGPFIGHALVKLKSAALIKWSSASTRKSPLFSGDSLQGKPYARGRHFKVALPLDPGL